jgi:hypothetical protein
VLRHHAALSVDGKDEGHPAPDGPLPVEHGPLGDEQLLLVIHPPRDDGAAVQVDGARRVVAAVKHYDRSARHPELPAAAAAADVIDCTCCCAACQ